MRIRTNTLLATALIPDGGGELRLYQRNEDFVIEVAGIPGELMCTAIHASEDALAELALKQVKDVSHARVLVGGLGMGFTLAAALRGVGARGEVVVAELVPEVVEWNKGPMGERSGNPMWDPRAKVFVGDVLELIRAERHAYDAILLDTDNGPEGLTQTRNNRLYPHCGLRSAYDALRPSGILAVWSTHPHAPFTKRLASAGCRVHEEKVHAHGSKGTWHHLWFAQRP